MNQAILSNFSATDSAKPAAASKPAIASSALLTLFNHWQDCRGERLMPTREDLAEELLSGALGELVLFELSCVASPQGDAPAPVGGMVAGMTTPYHEVMRLGEPIYGRHGARGDEERLLLPLSRDGNRVDTILVGVQRRR